MSIEKKSLISTLRTTKKANVAKDELGENPASASAATKAPTVRFKAGKFKAVKLNASKFTAVKS